MNTNILYYALRGLKTIGEENSFSAYAINGKIYIELKPSGKCFELSEDEIRSRAFEYLESEMDSIKNS